MVKNYKSAEELIGNTPLFSLNKIKEKYSLCANVSAKLEFFNPTGSIKDRAALYMINDAEEKGLIKKGSVIIEPTSGNTGIGLALICSTRGYKAIIVMPETMSEERRALMRAYGAEVVLSNGSLGMAGAIQKASELATKYDNAYIPSQFSNPANARSHFETTGPEIWKDTEGRVDIFVAGVGTGGTITGTGKYLKSKNSSVKVIGVEPSRSPFLTKGEKGTHGLQGIGAGFLPEVLDLSVLDEVITIDDKEAFEMCRELGRVEGLFVGITSAAAMCAVIKLAKREENFGKNIVTVFPDTGARYLSTGIFSEVKE